MQSSEIWHQRLAHPSNDALKTLISASQFLCNKNTLPSTCNACQLGKHVKLPFYSSSSSISSPFEIIHSDLRTSPIQSLSGIQYYVLFLDQYSHFYGYFFFAKRVKCSTISFNFIHMSSLNSTQTLNLFNVIMEASTIILNFIISLLLKE